METAQLAVTAAVLQMLLEAWGVCDRPFRMNPPNTSVGIWSGRRWIATPRSLRLDSVGGKVDGLR